MTDFFISYTAADRPWAEWIAWTLEAAAGSERTIAVLSPDYLRSLYRMAEWRLRSGRGETASKRNSAPRRRPKVEGWT